jgi:hypothetical protein
MPNHPATRRLQIDDSVWDDEAKLPCFAYVMFFAE